MDIFLTGGTGYLGGRLARALVASGHRVRLLYRSPEALPELPPGVLPVRGDLLRVPDLREALRGSDALVHTGALVQSFVPDPARMEAINVEAPRALFALARELGVPRVLYTSSFMALGPSSGAVIDEETPIARDRFFNAYERTKYLGNEVARAAQEDGVPLVILYPTVIFGPGELTDGNHVGRIVRDYLRRRLPGRVGRGSARWNYAFVEDVVRGHLLALERARPGSRYILGGENISMDDFLRVLEEVSGVPPPQRHIPKVVAKSIAAVLEAGARFSGTQPAMTRAVVDIYERDWVYSSRRAVAEIGYSPLPFREALANTVGWIRGVER